jgi:TIR domain
VARRKKAKVFVSYSRHDEALVRPLAGLLGVASSGVVFMDVASLAPGDHWEKEIIEAVEQASVFVLCWCCECEKSHFVAKEIGTALSDPAKKLVPVLLCSTALPAGLSQRQWLDLRGQIVHRCDHADRADAPGASAERRPLPAAVVAEVAPSPPPPAAHRKWGMGRALALGLAAVVCLAMLGVWTLSRTGAPLPEASPPVGAPGGANPAYQPSAGQPDSGQVNPGQPSGQGNPGQPAPLLVLVGIGSVVVVLGGVVFLVLRKVRKGRKPKEGEAEVLSAHVRRYFEGLGRDGQA